MMGAPDLNSVRNIAIGSDRRPEMLRHVTDLFIVSAEQLSESEISLFDDVLNRLIVDIEIAAKALLAMRLAPIANAPPRAICLLACDDAIEVAGPVLIQSERLDDATLIAAAKNKGQAHMLAIAQRRAIGEAVTEVLVACGDKQVLVRTAQNRGARFSDATFQQLAEKSDDDEGLAVSIGARHDIPPHLFRRLLDHASDYVRTKLEVVHPDHVDLVRQVVSEVKGRIESEELGALPIPIHGLTGLDKREADAAHLTHLARDGSFADLSMALARSCGMPLVFVENALKQRRSDTILLAAKANGLAWPVVKAILSFRARLGFMPLKEVEQSLASYERILPETAEKILHFYRAR
jgi:DNA polymerase III psi subunit